MVQAAQQAAPKSNITPFQGRLPPHSQEAEEAVLGACITNPDALANIAEFLHGADFYIKRHEYIWDALCALDAERSAIDIVTLTDSLKRAGQLADIGGLPYLLHLINNTPTSMHAEVYGRLVERAAVRRRVLVAADQIKALAWDESLPIEKVKEDAEKHLFLATDADDKQHDSRAKSVIQDYWQELEAKYTGDAPSGIPTGFRDLDAICGGLFRREVTVLAAPPGFGKTTLLLNIAQNALVLNQRVAFFSVEMGRKEAVQRFVSMEMGVPTALLKSGKLTAKQWELFVAVAGRIGSQPLHIIDEFKRLTPLQLQRRLRRLQHEDGVDLVLIDGLWKMYSHRQFDSTMRAREVDSIMEDLVALADQTNLPILITHQFNRESVRKVKGQKSRPKLSQLGDSSGVEKNAHVVWGMYRESYEDNKQFGSDATEVITLKARDGFYGTAVLDYEKAYSRYVDMPRRTP